MKIIIFIIGLLFRVSTIDCQISEKNCSPELYQDLETLKGKSFFFVDLNIDRLESYQKKFPGTLILNFNEEKLSYTVKFKEEIFYISELGNILENNQDTNNVTEVILNKEFNKNVHIKLLKIINITNKDNLRVKKIIWNSDQEIILEINNSPKIILDIEAIDIKTNILEILLNSREIKEYEEPIQEIDLRFNLPVLRTTQ
jgi:hypothetical protein